MLKLFVMMVLELFIWGAWLPLIWTYIGPGGLNFTPSEQGWIGSTFAIASIVGIFFSNEFADRRFSAEKFLAFSHLVGGLAILGCYVTKSFWPFFACLLVHSLLYVPTISVANALAFANLANPQQQFGKVRAGGTIGWILAAWPLYFLLKDKTGPDAIPLYKNIFIISGVASLALAAYALTLPHTPPKPAATKADNLAWVKALRLLGIPYILVLFVVTFIDSTIHNGYFAKAGGFLLDAGFASKWIMPIMSIGQVAEILTMLILGAALKKLGWKVTMIVGILGHTLRFAVFAFFPHSQDLLVLVQILHGICYAFFFATVYIFIDAAFPKDVRTSAQGLFNLLILGLGDLAAKWLFLTVLAGKDYKTVFLVPTALSLVAVVMLAIFFRPPKEQAVIGSAAPAH